MGIHALVDQFNADRTRNALSKLSSIPAKMNYISSLLVAYLIVGSASAGKGIVLHPDLEPFELGQNLTP